MTNRFQFIEDHHRAFGVKRLCQVLEVARSSFYKWRAGHTARAARERADAALAERIRAVHTEWDGTYGRPRITAELREDGERVNHKRVGHRRAAAAKAPGHHGARAVRHAGVGPAGA